MKNNSAEPPLAKEIQKEYDHLLAAVKSIPKAQRILKELPGTGGLVSVSDLLSYQIGWGKLLISWYESGLKGESPFMPGEGFSTWKYVEIAQHFYQKYAFDHFQKQEEVFSETVLRMLAIVNEEFKKGNLDKIGVWPWCKLSSGKEWPLSKWIKINTASPYKRAAILIKKWAKKHPT